MATTLKTMPCVYHSGTREVLELPEAASQTFKVGEFVELNANSQINICASGDVLTVGIALADASGTTNALCPVLIANNDTTFEITISGGSDPTLALTDLAVKYALIVANARSYVDVDDASGNDFFVITGLKLTADQGVNVAGDDYVRGYVKVCPEVFQFGDAAESA